MNMKHREPETLIFCQQILKGGASPKLPMALSHLITECHQVYYIHGLRPLTRMRLLTIIPTWSPKPPPQENLYCLVGIDFGCITGQQKNMY